MFSLIDDLYEIKREEPLFHNVSSSINKSTPLKKITPFLVQKKIIDNTPLSYIDFLSFNVNSSLKWISRLEHTILTINSINQHLNASSFLNKKNVALFFQYDFKFLNINPNDFPRKIKPLSKKNKNINLFYSEKLNLSSSKISELNNLF
jgi:hypothetical protein